MANASQSSASSQPLFGTFAGVFRPTVLTILGAMLYLRLGWVVGNNGLLGALLVILAGAAITGTTALSASSIATNQRVRPGGAFAIISQALGLEAGGAIGVPLYIAQALSAAMYAYAFSEVFADTWIAVFGGVGPAPVPVALVAFLGVALLAWRSAAVAFRAQGVLFVGVIVALVSLFTGVFTADLHAPRVLAFAPEVGLVGTFAIFFPALTGTIVGVGMSGQLANPRRSIPVGTLSAWAVTLAVYVAGALWYALVAEPAELVANKTIAFDRAAVGWVVRIGLLASTLTAALSSLIAASRLLQAITEHGLLPRARWMAASDPDGEPRRATLVTTGVAALGLLSGSLDGIAPIITAFFILTYLALNLVVLIEQQLGMISFRPTFAIPPWVPAAGVALCAAGLFFASPRSILFMGLFSVVGIYVFFARLALDTPWETVRSGVAVAVATWAARRASVLERSERSWKPDLLVPLDDPEQAIDLDPLLRATAARNGSVKLMAVGLDEALVGRVHRLRGRLTAAGIYTTVARISAEGFSGAFRTALDAMQGDLFPPNLVILDASRHDEATLQAAQVHCRALRLGLILFVPHPKGGLGDARRVDVWLSDRSPEWAIELHTANLDLPVLLGYLLATSWDGRLRVVMAVRDAESRGGARRFLARVVEACRLPDTTTTEVLTGDFLERLGERVPPDVNLFGLPETIDRARLLAIAERSGGACVFVMDSGRESAFA